jgi:aldose sugar dehydrogenase
MSPKPLRFLSAFFAVVFSIFSSYASESEKFRFEILTQQNDVVWGFDFLSSEKVIFTERKGALRVLNLADRSVSDISGAPKVWASGQGGLLDVRVHHSDQSLIYLTYSEPAGPGATTALGRAKLSGSKLEGFKKLFSAHAANSNSAHFGSRIEFDGAGHVFVTVGDRHVRDFAQSLAHHTGKLIRLKEDGSIPKDNPFATTKDAKPEIWTLGHRNAQGLARHPITAALWLAEMGPSRR